VAELLVSQGGLNTIILDYTRSNGQAGVACGTLSAVVSLRDGRAAALIRQLLESRGTLVRNDGDTARAMTWVVDPAGTGLEQAREWRADHPGGLLVLFGRPDPSEAPAWRAIDAVVIESSDDFETIRGALGHGPLVV